MDATLSPAGKSELYAKFGARLADFRFEQAQEEFQRQEAARQQEERQRMAADRLEQQRAQMADFRRQVEFESKLRHERPELFRQQMDVERLTKLISESVGSDYDNADLVRGAIMAAISSAAGGGARFIAISPALAKAATIAMAQSEKIDASIDRGGPSEPKRSVEMMRNVVAAYDQASLERDQRNGIQSNPSDNPPEPRFEPAPR